MRRLPLILLFALAPVLAQQPTRPPALRHSGVFNGTTRLRIAEPGGEPRVADVRIQVDDWIINANPTATRPLRFLLRI
jgi:hypothetical protein